MLQPSRLSYLRSSVAEKAEQEEVVLRLQAGAAKGALLYLEEVAAKTWRQRSVRRENSWSGEVVCL